MLAAKINIMPAVALKLMTLQKMANHSRARALLYNFKVVYRDLKVAPFQISFCALISPLHTNLKTVTFLCTSTIQGSNADD